jgi:hypothetical protein
VVVKPPRGTPCVPLRSSEGDRVPAYRLGAGIDVHQPLVPKRSRLREVWHDERAAGLVSKGERGDGSDPLGDERGEAVRGPGTPVVPDDTESPQPECVGQVQRVLHERDLRTVTRCRGGQESRCSGSADIGDYHSPARLGEGVRDLAPTASGVRPTVYEDDRRRGRATRVEECDVENIASNRRHADTIARPAGSGGTRHRAQRPGPLGPRLGAAAYRICR